MKRLKSSVISGMKYQLNQGMLKFWCLIIALYATPENRKYFEEKKTEINSQNENLIKDAGEILKKLAGQEVVLLKQLVLVNYLVQQVQKI